MLVSCRRSVDMVVNTILISYLLQILLRSSLSPDPYGIRMVYLGDSFDSPSLLHVGLTADLIMCSGYPFAPRTSAKCFFSLSISSADAIVLARCAFTCAGWCEVYCRYLSVCVVFLYIYIGYTMQWRYIRECIRPWKPV